MGTGGGVIENSNFHWLRCANQRVSLKNGFFDRKEFLSMDHLSEREHGGLPGTENLTSFADKRVLVWLRDNRKLFGVLRSFDQFGNLWLTDTVERFYHQLEYAEVMHGNFVVRGENVVFVGDFHATAFESSERRMAKFRRPLDYILPLLQEHTEAVSQQRRLLGANGEFAENDLY